MSISALGSSPAPVAPVALPTDNEAAEVASAPRFSLKEGTGTKIDVTA